MGVFGKLLRMKTLVMVGLIAAFCVAIYYFAVSRSWIGQGDLVPVNRDNEFPDDHRVKNRDRDIDDDHPGQYDKDLKVDPPDEGEKLVDPLNEGGKLVDPPIVSGDVKGQSANGKGVEGGVKVVSVPEAMKEVGEKEGEREGAERPVPDKGDSEIFVSQLTGAGMTGMLNYDLWRWIVGYTVDDMRIDKSFPNSPNERKTITKLHIEFDEEDAADIKGKYAHRVYGYLLPPTQGEYQFSIEMSDITAAASVELWLSTDSNPLNMRKVLDLNYDDMDRPMPRRATYKRSESPPVRMDSRVHYFEYLQKIYEGKAIVDVKWRQPKSEQFVELDLRTFAMAAKFDNEGKVTYGPHIDVIQGHLPSSELQTHRFTQFVGDVIYPITELDVLPPCDFKPAYAQPRKVKRYEAVYQIHESKVYPKDETWFKMWHKKDKGNAEIDKAVVDKALLLYTKAFNKSTKYKGQILKLRYMEETVNRNIATKKKRNPEVFGSRFLMELDIQLTEPHNQLVHTSEFVYLPKDSKELCHTANFQWRKSPTVDVYFIVSLKNLGLWVDHLIHNMEDIYRVTKDDHFELVIVDYQSEDMDVEEKLKQSSVNRWHVIKKTGSFSRSGGLQAGINYVTDPDSIVMTIDMHLTLPPGFVEYIRKHTIQGKMACTPFFFRLNKGYTEINFNGFWETLTYGLFSLFKSDWTRFGGFDLVRYKDKWGGEDWDILDRASALGIESFRIRYPGLVHYYHTKAGMWTGGGAKGRPQR